MRYVKQEPPSWSTPPSSSYRHRPNLQVEVEIFTFVVGVLDLMGKWCVKSQKFCRIQRDQLWLQGGCNRIACPWWMWWVTSWPTCWACGPCAWEFCHYQFQHWRGHDSAYHKTGIMRLYSDFVGRLHKSCQRDVWNWCRSRCCPIFFAIWFFVIDDIPGLDSIALRGLCLKCEPICMLAKCE